MIKMAMFVLNEIKPTSQLYERESEPGESGSAERSTLSMYITHYIEIMDLWKLQLYPRK